MSERGQKRDYSRPYNRRETRHRDDDDVNYRHRGSSRERDYHSRPHYSNNNDRHRDSNYYKPRSETRYSNEDVDQRTYTPSSRSNEKDLTSGTKSSDINEQPATSTDPEKKGSFAFVTLVMLGDSYVCGALVLGWSLKMVQTTAKLVVMVTNDVSPAAREALSEVYDEVIEVKFIESTAIQRESKRFQHMYKWLDKCFTKLNVLTLTHYDKVCLLDADMAAVLNPDAVFEVETPAGICSTIEKDKHWHGKRLGRDIISESLRHYGIRGCLYLLKPNMDEFHDISDHLFERSSYGNTRQYVGPDEKLITEFYKSDWHHIHHRFGCTAWKTDILQGEEPVILHFVSEKPWLSDNDWPDFKIWNQIATSLTQTKPSTLSMFSEKVKKRFGPTRTPIPNDSKSEIV